MATTENPDATKYANLSQSQKESAYFNMESNYDPAVYETDRYGMMRILGMLSIFYTIMGVHWWANFSLGIHATETSSVYNLLIFASAVLVISAMLFVGAQVNTKKITHEYYAEKISEEKIKQAEKQARANAKAAQEAKRLQG